MAIEIKMSTQEAEATYRILKSAERKAEALWQEKPSITNRLKFETIEAARIRFAQSLPA